MTKERNRELSEQKLIDTVGELIEEIGFEKLGINQIAKRAECSKTLIYRYFDSLDGLIFAYLKKYDFWANEQIEQPDLSDIKGYLKAFFRRQMTLFRKNNALKKLRRWELSTDKNFLDEIRARREKNGMLFLDMVSTFFKVDRKEMNAIAALIDTGIVYLAMFEDHCQIYNGIDIQSDKGWEQIAQGIDTLIDITIK